MDASEGREAYWPALAEPITGQKKIYVNISKQYKMITANQVHVQ